MILQHFSARQGGQFAPESTGQFPPKQVVNLLRNGVINSAGTGGQFKLKRGGQFHRIFQQDRKVQEFNLKPASIKAEYGKSETKKAIANVLDKILNEYKFTTMGGWEN